MKYSETSCQNLKHQGFGGEEGCDTVFEAGQDVKRQT